MPRSATVLLRRRGLRPAGVVYRQGDCRRHPPRRLEVDSWFTAAHEPDAIASRGAPIRPPAGTVSLWPPVIPGCGLTTRHLPLTGCREVFMR